jgi:hypothetical protein
LLTCIILSNVLFSENNTFEYNRMEELIIGPNGAHYIRELPQNLEEEETYIIVENANPAMRMKGVYFQMIDGTPTFTLANDTIQGFDVNMHTFYGEANLPLLVEGGRRKGKGKSKSKARKSRKVQSKKSKKSKKTKRM